MRRKDHSIGAGIDTCIIDKVADKHAFPQKRHVPPFDTMKRNNLGIMLVVVNYLPISQDPGR